MEAIKDKQFYNTTCSAIATVIIVFSNLFLLFLTISHVDLYLEKFSSIY